MRCTTSDSPYSYEAELAFPGEHPRRPDFTIRRPGERRCTGSTSGCSISPAIAPTGRPARRGTPATTSCPGRTGGGSAGTLVWSDENVTGSGSARTPSESSRARSSSCGSPSFSTRVHRSPSRHARPRHRAGRRTAASAGLVLGSYRRTASAAAARSVLARCSPARSGGTNQRDGHSAAARPGIKTSLNSRPFARLNVPTSTPSACSPSYRSSGVHRDAGGGQRAGMTSSPLRLTSTSTAMSPGSIPLVIRSSTSAASSSSSSPVLRSTCSSAGSPTVSGSGSSPVGRRPTSSSRSSNRFTLHHGARRGPHVPGVPPVRGQHPGPAADVDAERAQREATGVDRLLAIPDDQEMRGDSGLASSAKSSRTPTSVRSCASSTITPGVPLADALSTSSSALEPQRG